MHIPCIMYIHEQHEHVCRGLIDLLRKYTIIINILLLKQQNIQAIKYYNKNID